MDDRKQEFCLGCLNLIRSADEHLKAEVVFLRENFSFLTKQNADMAAMLKVKDEEIRTLRASQPISESNGAVGSKNRSSSIEARNNTEREDRRPAVDKTTATAASSSEPLVSVNNSSTSSSGSGLSTPREAEKRRRISPFESEFLRRLNAEETQRSVTNPIRHYSDMF